MENPKSSIRCLAIVVKNILGSKNFNEKKEHGLEMKNIEFENLFNGPKKTPLKGITDALVGVIDKPVSYEEFFTEFLSKNKPCLLENWVTKDWPCNRNWTSISSTFEKVTNFAILEDLCQNAMVPVSNCRFVNL